MEEKLEKIKLVVTGGGSGGHVTPIVALLEEMGDEFEIHWLGSKHGPEKGTAKSLNIPYEAITTGKLRRYISLQNIIDFFKFPLGIIQAYFILGKIKPQIVFGKGGYVSLPVVIAAKFRGIKTLVHESDVYPGLANRIAMRFANLMLLTFSESKKYLKKNNYQVVGTPIRKSILNGSAEEARNFFKFQTPNPKIFITGGSQGAARLNQVILEALPELTEKYEIIHLAGKNNYENLREQTKSVTNYNLYSFFNEEMKLAYAVADIIISRAGANSLAEIAAYGKPAIVVPITIAGDHQKYNAEVFAKAGAAYLIKEEGFTKAELLRTLSKHFTEENCSKMAHNSQKLVDLDGTKRIIKLIKKYAQS
ncbi:MAG: undecaprenyldiphospho-muramoylpentapeptide beta-N-acetylglucosaminyltransferase [bacterium]